MAEAERVGPILIPQRLPDPLPWWRFSLRECFLAVAAIAALLALYSSFVFFGPSYLNQSLLINQFAMTDHMRAVAGTLSIQLSNVEDTGGMTTSGTDMNSRMVTYRIEVPPDSRTRLIDRLHRDARELIRQDGMKFVFDGPLPADHDLPGFRINYMGPYSRGEIFVRVVDRSDSEMELIVFEYEHLKRRR